MFKAIGRYIRAFCYLITGKIEAARKTLAENPNVIAATFDEVIEEKKGRIQQYRDAISRMMVQEEKKKQKLKTVNGEVEHYTRLKSGAANKAKQIVSKHGGNGDAAKADPEYQHCLDVFKDVTATLEEKVKRAEELESDLSDLVSSIGEHKNNIQRLLRDFEKVKEEKDSTIGDVISAKEQREINDMLTGISQDDTSRQLEDMRNIRQEAIAKARMSREMAGLDAAKEEQDFLAYANDSAANDEFEKMIGLKKEVDVQITHVDGQEVEEETRRRIVTD